MLESSLCIDMCIDMCIDRCIDMRVDMCIDMPVDLARRRDGEVLALHCIHTSQHAHIAAYTVTCNIHRTFFNSVRQSASGLNDVGAFGILVYSADNSKTGLVTQMPGRA